MGHDVCAIASNEAKAEAAAAEFHPDLMIVDGTLRGGSGVVAMQRILAAGDVAHFYVTGNPWSVLELIPAAIVVTKPYTMRDLQRGMTTARDAARLRLDAGK
jgi:DNA-binding response OmpR family regulator